MYIIYIYTIIYYTYKGSELDQVTECKMGMMLFTPIIPNLKALKLYLGNPSRARQGTVHVKAHGKKR